MDFLQQVSALVQKEHAVQFYETLVFDHEDAVQFAVTDPGRFRQAMLQLQTRAGYGFTAKTNKLRDLILAKAEAKAADALASLPTKKVIDCLHSHPSERVVPKATLENLKVPHGFVLDATGVKKLVLKGDEFIEVPVLSEPVLIAGTAKYDGDNVRHIYLVFRDIGMKWHKLMLTLEDIGSHHKLLGLAKFGIGINNDNKQKVMRYLVDFWELNKHNLPRISVMQRLGWTDDGRFVWPDQIVSPALENPKHLVFEPHPNFASKAAAFHVKGDYETWLATLEVVRKYPIAMFAIYWGLAGFALSLFDDLSVKPATLDIGAKTGTGKSTISNIMLSLFGKPGFSVDEAGMTWNTSAKYAEQILGSMHSIPVVFDDTKHLYTNGNHVRVTKNLVKFVFAVHDKQGFARLNRDSTMKETKYWNTLVTMSGEESLNRKIRDDEGARARIVPIEQFPFGPKKDATKRDIMYIDAKLKQNYGHFGRKWVEFLVKLWADADHSTPAIIKSLYHTHEERISAWGSTTESERTAKYLAAVMTCKSLAEDFLGLPKPVDDLEPLLRQIIQDVAYQSNRGDRALRELIEHLQHNPHNVIGLGANDHSTINAAWPQKGKPYITITRQAIESFLALNGNSPRQTLQEWMENGYFVIPSDAKYNGNNLDSWIRAFTVSDRFILPSGARRTVRGLRVHTQYIRDIIMNDDIADTPVEDRPAPQEIPKNNVGW